MKTYLNSFLSIDIFLEAYPTFLILHFVFASLSCTVGSLSYFLKHKIPNFWHHFFYFLLFLTGIIAFLMSLKNSSLEKFLLGTNLFLLAYLPLQRRGIAIHARLGFLILGIAFTSLLVGLQKP